VEARMEARVNKDFRRRSPTTSKRFGQNRPVELRLFA
jgi:hypothetical protein